MERLTELFKYTTLSSSELCALGPIIVLSFLAVIVLIIAATANDRGHSLSSWTSLIGTLVIMIFQAQDIHAPEVTILGDILIFNPFTRVLSLIVMGIGFLSLLLVTGQSKREGLSPEIYPLVLFSMAGMVLLAQTNHLMFMFIAIEIMSLAVYVLVGMQRTASYSVEASIKYFILGGAASAMLVYGSALVYGATGTFGLRTISNLLSMNSVPALSLLSAGGLLVLCGLLFKVGAFPFHFWIPDVYQGAAHSVTGFMSAAVKFAAFIPLIKISQQLYFALPGSYGHLFYVIIWLLAALTMIYANFTALTQHELKRLLAYSAIAHTGYLLAGVLVCAEGKTGAAPIIVYLTFYVFSALGAMGIVILLADKHQRDVSFTDLAGVAEKRPYLAFALSIFMLAMAGIPMTAGFIGKYILLSNVVTQGGTLLVVIAVLSSLISVYYYLRVIVLMYMEPETGGLEKAKPGLLAGPIAVAGIMLLVTIQFGLFPRIVIDYIYRILQ
ncbi:MAG: NADH-quinone oxidoreductase subunit N [Bdellovibrio sp.]|nr:NADH-quinone oxidoreductase subunit N [Bdellovibrio sp.]